MYLRHYDDHDGSARRFLNQRFHSIETMLQVMRDECGVALRESNWMIFGYRWLIIPIRITIADLVEAGFIKTEPVTDEFGIYYPYAPLR